MGKRNFDNQSFAKSPNLSGKTGPGLHSQVRSIGAGNRHGGWDTKGERMDAYQ